MMTDCELLEMAAKAAGYKLNQSVGGGFYVLGPNKQTLAFEPLSDDGAALRLAISLKLDVMFFNRFQEVCVQADVPYDGEPVEVNEKYTSDMFSATRRAIVRAAAEIGRNM